MKLAWPVALAATVMLWGGTASAGRPRQAPLFPLQFGATGTVLFVAGYTVDPLAGVTGECDYKVSHSGSGRGGGYKVVTDYYQGVCTWDLFGSLLSQTFTKTAGAPVPHPPIPLYMIGNQITYGIDASGDSTGQTSTTTGFVIHNTADYVWMPVSQITTDAQTPASFQATLTSTGNLSLDVTGSNIYSGLGASVTVLGDTCTGQAILPGQSCTITLSYDPSGLVSDTGTAFDTISIEISTNSGRSQAPFTQSIFVTGVND